MDDADNQQHSFVGKLAVVLFISGLLAPFVLILLTFFLHGLVFALSGAKSGERDVGVVVPYVVAAGIIAEVLALILAIVAGDHAKNLGHPFAAKCALVLFVSGPLAPCVLTLFVAAICSPKAVGDAVRYAIALGIIAEVLSLILGIAGRQHVAGKTAMVGAGILVGLALAAAVLSFVLNRTEGVPTRTTGERTETTTQSSGGGAIYERHE